MIPGAESVRISLRQADGEYFPLFHRGDPDTRNLALVPAREEQDEAEIQFFHHADDVSRPEKLGSLRFPDLPSEGEGRELQLDAVIGSTGLLSVTVRNPASGRVERLEMELPDEGGRHSASRSSGLPWRSGPLRWVLGGLFLVAALAFVGYLTWLVTDWGREDPAPAPVSMVVDSSVTRT